MSKRLVKEWLEKLQKKLIIMGKCFHGVVGCFSLRVPLAVFDRKPRV